jgi:hypothetical protein
MRSLSTALALVGALALALAAPSFGGVKRFPYDLKLATQAMLEHQLISNPAAGDTNGVLLNNAGPTSAAAASVTSFAAQPDVPRNVLITPTGVTADVESCTITVTGTNIFGASITETFAFSANASSATTGAKAFKTITSVAWPADCESGGFGAIWSIGYGEKLGLHRCLDAAGNWAWSTVSGVYESTRATVAADADEVEKNTADFNGTMDGSADFDGYFVQNYRCKP